MMADNQVVDIAIIPDMMVNSYLYGTLFAAVVVVAWALGGLWYFRRCVRRQQAYIRPLGRIERLWDTWRPVQVFEVTLWLIVLTLGIGSLSVKGFGPAFDHVRVHRDQLRLSFSTGHREVVIPIANIVDVDLRVRRTLKHTKNWIEIQLRDGALYESVSSRNHRERASVEAAYARLEALLPSE